MSVTYYTKNKYVHRINIERAIKYSSCSLAVWTVFISETSKTEVIS